MNDVQYYTYCYERKVTNILRYKHYNSDLHKRDPVLDPATALILISIPNIPLIGIRIQEEKCNGSERIENQGLQHVTT